MPGIPDTAREYVPARAIDLEYLQWELFGIVRGEYTPEMLFSAGDWEKESELAVEKLKEDDMGSWYPKQLTALANSQAIRKYREGPDISNKKNTALLRCYFRSADLYSSRTSSIEAKEFAEEMYDRSLEYIRFNVDTRDGRIHLLVSQGNIVAAREAQDQEAQVMDEQHEQSVVAIRLPVPGYLAIIALIGAMFSSGYCRRKKD